MVCTSWCTHLPHALGRAHTLNSIWPLSKVLQQAEEDFECVTAAFHVIVLFDGETAGQAFMVQL